MIVTRMMIKLIMVMTMIIFYKGEDGDVNEEEDDDDGKQRDRMLLFLLPLLLPMSPHHPMCAYVCERNIVCGCVRETSESC